MAKKLIILRGVPGSGKTWLAQKLKAEQNAHVFCNDDLLTDEYGVHVWTEERSLWAHHENQKLAAKAMREGLSPLVLDNPNLRPFVATPYVRIAKYYNYKWEVMEPNTSWAHDLGALFDVGTHNVPFKQLKSYLETWEKIPIAGFKALLVWETAMDPEVSLRFATICLERGEKFQADEALIEYHDWRRIEGYEPEGGDELASRLGEKMEDWRATVYNLRNAIQRADKLMEDGLYE